MCIRIGKKCVSKGSHRQQGKKKYRGGIQGRKWRGFIAQVEIASRTTKTKFSDLRLWIVMKSIPVRPRLLAD